MRRPKKYRPFSVTPKKQKAKKKKAGGVKKLKGAKGAYRHEFDPYSEFPTQAAAMADRKRMVDEAAILGTRLKARKARVPTFFTVLHYESKSNTTGRKLAAKPQGPHVVSHINMLMKLTRVRQTMAEGDIQELFELLPTVQQYRRIVRDEVVQGWAQARARIAVRLYRKRYDEIIDLMNEAARDEAEDIALIHTINKAINLHPYTTHSYYSYGAKPNVKGKGETRDTLNIDLPRYRRNMAASNAYIDETVGLLSS